MTGKRELLLALWLMSAGLCSAADHPACREPAYDWLALTPGELRSIAATCSTPSFGELNYHRAYLRDLLGEDAAVAGLISWTAIERQPAMESHGVHMLLLEQLAPLYLETMQERVAFLNAEYEVRNEIAELWLRGYGTLAARLSERHTSNTTRE